MGNTGTAVTWQRGKVLGRVRSSILIASFGWIFGGDFAGKLAVAVTTIVAVRALTPNQFGRYVGLAATAVLAAAVWDAGVSTVVTREVAANRVAWPGVLQQILKLRAATLVGWICVFAAGTVVLSRGSNLSLLPTVGFAGASLCFATHSLFLGMLRGRLSFHLASLASAAGRWSTAALSAAGLVSYTVPSRLGMLALALFVGEVVTLCLSVLFVIRVKTRFQATNRAQRLTLRLALPFAGNSLASLAYNRFDVVLLSALSTLQQLSLYAPASRIQDALYIIPASISVLALPLAAAALQDGATMHKARSIVARLTAMGLALTIPAAVLAFIYARGLITVMLGATYVGATVPTRILIWSMPLAAIGAPLLAVLSASEHAVDSTKAFAVALFVSILLNLALDPFYGATGAAIAGVLRDLANVLTALFYVSRLGLLPFLSRQAAQQEVVTVA